MKRILILLLVFCVSVRLVAQGNPSDRQKAEIQAIVDQYSMAREKRDTVLLKNILTADVDQLVSTGEWRLGIRPAVQGMLRSSQNNSGARSLVVDKIRMLTDQAAIADCRYEIQNADGSARNMWSTFVVVKQKGSWKISAIRNMLPASP